MNVKIVLLLALVALAEAQRRPTPRPGRGGRGGKGDRKGKFFDESCKPECEDGSKSFALMVSDDTDCPTDFSDKQALRGTFAKPWEFCAAEVCYI